LAVCNHWTGLVNIFFCTKSLSNEIQVTYQNKPLSKSRMTTPFPGPPGCTGPGNEATDD